MRSFGPRKDPDGVVQHARVATTGDYQVHKILWRRRVGTTGMIRCELLRRRGGLGKRPIRLIAEYEDAGVFCQDVVYIQSPLEELAEAGRLEAKIRVAELHDALANATSPPSKTPE